MTPGLPCYFLLSSLPPQKENLKQRGICTEVTFCTQELLLIYGTIPAFPAIAPVKQDSAQPAAERALPRIIVFPGKTAWPGYALLSFSPQIYQPPQKWPFWSKSKRFGLQRKQKMSHSLKHFTWLLPPPPSTTTRDLTGIECSQRWGRSLAWCQWPFSPQKFRNSPALIGWYKVAEEEGIHRERRGKTSQTRDRWWGDREESGQKGGKEICQKPGRNDTQRYPLLAWQASPHKGAGNNPLRNYFAQHMYL